MTFTELQELAIKQGMVLTNDKPDNVGSKYQLKTSSFVVHCATIEQVATCLNVEKRAS
tara:strand:+ start:2358 stop:2531 length:174 start_codon:yes stop_codon:yes gene_type:complete